MRKTIRLTAAAVTEAACVGAAVAYVALNNWFGAADIYAMAWWSIPLSGLVYLALSLPWLKPPTHALVQYSVALAMGLLLAVLWVVVAALLLGGWIMAFSFPVLLCWGFGSVLGVTAGVWLADRKFAVAPAGVVLLAAVVLLQGFNHYRTPAPAAMLYLQAGASQEEIQLFWEEVLGEPHPSGEGFGLKPGISGVAATGSDGPHKTLTVSFWKSTDAGRRSALADSIASSPLVDRIRWLDRSEQTLRQSVEY